MSETDYYGLNAQLNLRGPNGEIQFDKDREAARAYFLEHVNQNTVFFHSIEEKLGYLIDEGYYDADQIYRWFSTEELKELYKYAYSFKFRFPTFVGALKFYQSYALKTKDGSRYLERYEDRVVAVAATLADNFDGALDLIRLIITGVFQPATPTFLNAGRLNSGDLVSCYLLRVEDNMESISRGINASLQLSKRGGGVALLLSNLREFGAPIKGVDGQSTGVIPVMKILEDTFSYSNQLGARPGAGAVYLHAHHPDIMKFLDTKRENADEKIRIKTLSLGVVIPDITFDLARDNKEMYLFSPYDVERKYGKAFSDINVTDVYHELVDDPDIRKSKINAREFFKTLAEVQFESGYPYIMFEDTVNRANPIAGKVTHSNLCSEILQVSTPSKYNDDLSYRLIGDDILCNLGSMNVARAMEQGRYLDEAVDISIRALTEVSELSDVASVPSIAQANETGHPIGLGQMNLAGFLAKEGIVYGSDESVEFTHAYFSTILYHALVASNGLAQRRGAFEGFWESDYADGGFFVKYIENDYRPYSDKVKSIFEKYEVEVATPGQWWVLRNLVMNYGLYNRYLLAIPPTGSISYINGATASIHPITSQIETRKEGQLGRVYFPAPEMTEENREYFVDAFDVGPEGLIDVYAAATEHVDQGLSLTLFFPDTATTRDINKAQVYAHKKGIKTIYYVRIRQQALAGTESEECISCKL